jgi:hypothetical protein
MCALSPVDRLRRAVPRRFGFDAAAVELGALFGALQAHLEKGGDLAVVEACRESFITLATLRGIDPACIEKATTILQKLTRQSNHDMKNSEELCSVPTNATACGRSWRCAAVELPLASAACKASLARVAGGGGSRRLRAMTAAVACGGD